MTNKHGIKHLSETRKPSPDFVPTYQTFTATIHHNMRDTHTLSAKILLTYVHSDGELVRNHMWINLNELPTTFIPKSTREHLTLTFRGALKSYQTRSEMKQTIVNICDIQLALC